MAIVTRAGKGSRLTKSEMDANLVGLQAGVDGKASLAGGAAFTTSPTVPTPSLGDNTTKVANMAAVKQAFDAIVAGAPAAVDTLNEIGTRLANGETVDAALTGAIAGKLSTSATTAFTRTFLASVDAASARGVLGIQTALDAALAVFLGSPGLEAKIAEIVGALAPPPSGWQVVATTTSGQVKTGVAVPNWMPEGAIGMVIVKKETFTGAPSTSTLEILNIYGADEQRIVWENHHGEDRDWIAVLNTGQDAYRAGIGPAYINGGTRITAAFISNTKMYAGPYAFEANTETEDNTHVPTGPVTLTVGHANQPAAIEVLTAPLYAMPARSQRLAVYAQAAMGFTPPGPSGSGSEEFTQVLRRASIAGPVVPNAPKPMGVPANLLTENQQWAKFTPDGNVPDWATFLVYFEDRPQLGDLSIAPGYELANDPSGQWNVWPRLGDRENYRSVCASYPPGHPRALHKWQTKGLALCALGTGPNNADVSDGNIEMGMAASMVIRRRGSIKAVRLQQPKGECAWGTAWGWNRDVAVTPNPAQYPATNYPDGNIAPHSEDDLLDSALFDGADRDKWFSTFMAGDNAEFQRTDLYRRTSGNIIWHADKFAWEVPAGGLTTSINEWSEEWTKNDLRVFRFNGEVYWIVRYLHQWPTLAGQNKDVGMMDMLSCQAVAKKYDVTPIERGRAQNKGGLSDGWEMVVESQGIWKMPEPSDISAYWTP